MKVQVNGFTAISPIAGTLFNKLRKDADFGIPSVYIDGEEVNMNERALLGALNLILNNEGTTDAWLQAALTTVLPCAIDLKTATRINRWMIAGDIVCKRSSKEPAMVSGRLISAKVWKLTPDWEFSVQLAKLQEVEKVKTREYDEVPTVNRVKGTSEGSSITLDVLHRLDDVALAFHPATLKMAKEYSKSIDDADSEVEVAKSRELDAVVAEFKKRGTKEFFLTHTNDSRGRIYARGGFISTQASKLQKAVLRFAEAECATDMEEIMIYKGRLAGCKGTNEEAYALAMVTNHNCLESQSIISAPNTAIIRLDGCSNGIQWMSAFLNNKEGMSLTNLTGYESLDLYSTIQDVLGMDSRGQAKQFVMPYSYGASAYSLARELDVDEKEVHGMINEVNKILPIKSYLNHVKREAKFSPQDSYSWVMPDGFRVVHEYSSYDTINAGTFSANLDGTRTVDERKMIAALAPNIIHSIDAYHARLIIRLCDFPVVPIHDSFGCHSSNVKRLRQVIRESFKLVLKHDVLNSIMDDLGFDRFECTPNPELVTNPYMFR